MSRSLKQPDDEPKSRTCQVKKNTAGYFCVRCRWSDDTEDVDAWSCCPACGAELVPEKRSP